MGVGVVIVVLNSKSNKPIRVHICYYHQLNKLQLKQNVNKVFGCSPNSRTVGEALEMAVVLLLDCFVYVVSINITSSSSSSIIMISSSSSSSSSIIMISSRSSSSSSIIDEALDIIVSRVSQ